MILNYGKLKKFCTFCTEHIEFDENTSKCSTIYTLYEVDRKSNYHKVEFKYNIDLNAWLPTSSNANVSSFHVKGILLNSPNAGIYNRHALGVGGFDENAKTCYIVFDDKTLLPVITKKPRNIDEMVELISVEPRYIAQLDPCLIKTERQAVLEAALKAHAHILQEQVKLNAGKPYTIEEAREREIFSKYCLDAIETYVNKCTIFDNTQSSLDEMDQE